MVSGVRWSKAQYVDNGCFVGKQCTRSHTCPVSDMLISKDRPLHSGSRTALVSLAANRHAVAEYDMFCCRVDNHAMLSPAGKS